MLKHSVDHFQGIAMKFLLHFLKNMFGQNMLKNEIFYP